MEPWDHVVKSQGALYLALMLTTILTTMVIAQHDVVSAELDPARYLDILSQQKNGRHLDGGGRAVDLPVLIVGQNFSVL
jgi:hypothetical protein